MTETAGVFNNHRDVAEIGALPHRRFNSDFHGDADNGKGVDAAIPQRDVKRRTFERRHSDLVEDGFAWQWIYLRDQMESRRVPQEPRLDLVWRFHALPSHRHAELRYSHQFLGQRHMAREKDANARFACRIEDLKDFVRDLLT